MDNLHSPQRIVLCSFEVLPILSNVGARSNLNGCRSLKKMLHRLVLLFFTSLGGTFVPFSIYGSGIGSRAVLHSYRRLKTEEKEILIRWHGYKMYVSPKDIGVAQEVITQEYERAENEVFRGITKKGMNVVDAGANVGIYSIVASRLVGASGSVYSFEPETYNFRLLSANLRANGCRNVIATKKGLSDKQGWAKLFLHSDNYGGHSFASSNVKKTKEMMEVETTTLDSFLPNTRIDVLKMDVQGAEGNVLRGSKHFLDQESGMIFMEFWPYGLRANCEDPFSILQIIRDHSFRPRVALRSHGPAVCGWSALNDFAKTTDSRKWLNLLFEKAR